MCHFFAQITGNLIAAAIGIILYKKLPRGYKWIWIQVFVGLIVEITGHYLGKGNVWLFNLYLLLDCGILITASYFLIQKNFFIYILPVLYIIFLYFWVVDIKNRGMHVFADHAFAIEGVILISLYILILWLNLLQYKRHFLAIAVLSIAIILFYGCITPYFSMLKTIINQLTINQQNMLHLSLLDVVNNIHYFLITVSFIICPKHKIKKVIN